MLGHLGERAYSGKDGKLQGTLALGNLPVVVHRYIFAHLPSDAADIAAAQQADQTQGGRSGALTGDTGATPCRSGIHSRRARPGAFS